MWIWHCAEGRRQRVDVTESAGGEQIAPYKQHDRAAKAYTSYARMFQSHVARVEIAIRCKDELPCFAAILKDRRETVVAAIKPYLDASTWDSAELDGLLDAATDRALLEIGKRGAAAAELTDPLIDRLMAKSGTPSRIVARVRGEARAQLLHVGQVSTSIVRHGD